MRERFHATADRAVEADGIAFFALKAGLASHFSDDGHQVR